MIGAPIDFFDLLKGGERKLSSSLRLLNFGKFPAGPGNFRTGVSPPADFEVSLSFPALRN